MANKAKAEIAAGECIFSNTGRLSLIAGPCQLESRQHAFDIAGTLKEITSATGCPEIMHIYDGRRVVTLATAGMSKKENLLITTWLLQKAYLSSLTCITM